MRRGIIKIIAGCIIFQMTGPAVGQGANASSATEFARIADRLKPGEWGWAPTVAPNGQVLVYVDLSRQLATVYRNGIRIGVASISSGKPGHERPTGVFTILQKDANHHSSKYNDAPMPFSAEANLGRCRSPRRRPPRLPRKPRLRASAPRVFA